MNDREATAFVRRTMKAFAEHTGLVGDRSATRYLWTDAFAVCNFLELERRIGDGSYHSLAIRLVDQVHRVLARHRADDPRTGWISGLGENEGTEHPTRGGLRIGKPLNERGPDEPLDEEREWDRDGQYFHYLTRWMHALSRVASVTRETRYVRWALELADTAYERFARAAYPGGPRRLYWKMSVDLSRPLVEAMGQHDPLDGLVTFMELRATAEHLGQPLPVDLDAKITTLAAMCEGERLATADALGIGGLLVATHMLAVLQLAGAPGREHLIATLLAEALPGLEYQAANPDALSLPPIYRLAFRELGLSIGLRAIRQTRALLARSPAILEAAPSLREGLDALEPYMPLIETIETFWLEPSSRESATWREHQDINAVMLATSLAPEGYLAL